MQGQVAPLAGAWIEIFYYQYWREVLFVAPLAGAWIEIVTVLNVLIWKLCRSPRGSVD